MTTQDQITAAYNDHSLPWITKGGTPTRIYMVRTPLGHLESEDPNEGGGYPVTFRDDVRRWGTLAGEFPELGRVQYESGQIPITEVWADGTHGKWVKCDPFGKTSAVGAGDEEMGTK